MTTYIQQLYKNESYITIKDHTEHFPNKICRLINPSKSDIGKISKTISEKIITKIVSLANVNQWKNSTLVIEWYKTIPNKDQYRFIFDIENFYPSISIELFNEALNFVKTLTDISETDVSIMMQVHKTLLFKACVCYFHQFFIFSPNDSHSKTMKNAFYFIKKALCVLKIIKIFYFRPSLFFSLSPIALEGDRR